MVLRQCLPRMFPKSGERSCKLFQLEEPQVGGRNASRTCQRDILRASRSRNDFDCNICSEHQFMTSKLRCFFYAGEMFMSRGKFVSETQNSQILQWIWFRSRFCVQSVSNEKTKNEWFGGWGRKDLKKEPGSKRSETFDAWSFDVWRISCNKHVTSFVAWHQIVARERETRANIYWKEYQIFDKFFDHWWLNLQL